MYLHLVCHILHLKSKSANHSNFILHIAVTLGIDLSILIFRAIRIHIEHTVLTRLTIDFAINSSILSAYNMMCYHLLPQPVWFWHFLTIFVKGSITILKKLGESINHLLFFYWVEENREESEVEIMGIISLALTLYICYLQYHHVPPSPPLPSASPCSCDILIE